MLESYSFYVYRSLDAFVASGFKNLYFSPDAKHLMGLSLCFLLPIYIYNFDNLNSKLAKTSIGLIMALLIFFTTQAPIDELMVNLEHSYNLYHHMLFSFSPKSMVDGTVELLFYWAHSFAANKPETLIIFNQIFSLLIFLLSIFFLIKLSDSIGLKNKALPVLLSLMFFRFVEIYSEGFGNSLIGLVFIICLFLAETKSKWLYLFLSILSFCRPDAILHNIKVFITMKNSFYKKLMMAIFASILGMSLYYLTFIAMYSEYPPTPIQFKSFHLSMLHMLEISDFFKAIKLFISPTSLFLLFTSLFGIYINAIPYRYLFASLFSLSTLIAISTINFNPAYSLRYSIGFLILLLICTLYSLDKISFKFPKWNKYLVLILAFIASAEAYHEIKFRWPIKANLQQAINSNAIGAQSLRSLIPQNWVVAATELNSFGLFWDNEIVDLWGYTNESIARSKYCNKRRIKVNPDAISISKPDLIWFRTIPSHDKSELILIKNKIKENLIPMISNFSERYYQAGEPEKFLQQYTGILIEQNNWVHLLYINNNHLIVFKDILEKKTYSLINTLQVTADKIKFKTPINSILIPCQ